MNITEVLVRGEVEMRAANPMQVEYTMQITLALDDWQKLREAITKDQQSFPQSIIRERISDAVRQVMQNVRGRDANGDTQDKAPDETS